MSLLEFTASAAHSSNYAKPYYFTQTGNFISIFQSDIRVFNPMAALFQEWVK